MAISLGHVARARPFTKAQMDELRDIFLNSEQRSRVARMRRIIESCDRLLSLAEQETADGIIGTVTVKHACDFIALARSLAMELEGVVREQGYAQFQQQVASQKRPRGRPKKPVGLFDGVPAKERRPAGRPKNVTDEQMKRYLESFIREKQRHEREAGRKVSDLAFWRAVAQRTPDVRPRDVERLAKLLASDFSKARQKFGVPLRKKRSAKSQNPPNKSAK